MSAGAGTPAHLLAEPGAKRALCGSTDYPRVVVWHYPMHAAGYGLASCPDCLAEPAPTAPQGRLW